QAPGRQRQGDVAPGDRRRAGTAVCLDDIAVDPDRPLAERGQIDDAAQAAADQALDLVRSPADPTARRFARDARRARPGQHAVLRRDPAAAGVAQELWDVVLDRGGTDDARVADLDQDRAVR